MLLLENKRFQERIFWVLNVMPPTSPQGITILFFLFVQAEEKVVIFMLCISMAYKLLHLLIVYVSIHHLVVSADIVNIRRVLRPLRIEQS
jgi:hypothetical protein